MDFFYSSILYNTVKVLKLYEVKVAVVHLHPQKSIFLKDYISKGNLGF